jgi:hypothetical protein
LKVCECLLRKSLACLCFLLFAACQGFSGSSSTTSNSSAIPAEVTVLEIPLSGSAAGRRAEISGMAWYGDTLILLPQFPDRFGTEQKGAVFGLSKTILLDYVEKNHASPVEPEIIPFDDGGISQKIKNFEGFEAIAFDGEKVYLTIESSPNHMKGYVISGRIDPNGSGITLNPASLTEIPMQADLANISDESIILFGDKIFTLYEANGERVNPNPVAHLFDRSLQFLGVLSLPTLEYRITDAAPPDPDGYFWAINAYFPPDQWKLKPGEDFLAERYGLGETHLDNITVERLILFQVEGLEIRLAEVPPVQLHLAGDVAPRNWEALALLDQQGFLIATDKFPRTILGFVPFEFDP